jgi:YD repeat-containing protein
MATLPSAAQDGKIATTATVPGLGTYSYDGAGNITGVGSDRFIYDEFGRIRKATLVQGSTTHVQEFTYDRYGNIRRIVTSGESNPAVPAVNEATNRINLPGPTTNMVGEYDAAGNLTRYNEVDRFKYDALNVMTESTVGAERRLYLYTAGNERIAVLKMAGTTVASSDWTLRDASAKVLRRFARDANGTWRWDEDYVYRGSQLLAAEVPGNTLHFHLDHLGTPRVITGNGGARIATHTYYPFGRELTSPA